MIVNYVFTVLKRTQFPSNPGVLASKAVQLTYDSVLASNK